MEDRIYTLTLTGSAVLLIARLLAELPYKDVVGLIADIQAQTAAQEVAGE